MTEPHVRTLLGGYTLGILDDDERRTVAEHIDSCPECRQELAEVTEATEMLALLDRDDARGTMDDEPQPAGPLEDDLVLRRTLRAVRAERGGAQMRRLSLVAAGIVVLVGASIVGGFVAGDQSAQREVAQRPTASAAPSTPAAPGATTLTATDQSTGVGATATVVPAANWVRLSVKVTGVAAGEHCQLVAISKSGVRQVAGNWVVSEKGSAPGAPAVQGSASIAPADLAALQVVTESGRQLVTVPV
jgi:hypothetical protein